MTGSRLGGRFRKATVDRIRSRKPKPGLVRLRRRVRFFWYLLVVSIVISIGSAIALFFLKSSAETATSFFTSLAAYFSNIWSYAAGIWFVSTLFLWSTEAVIEVLERDEKNKDTTN